MSTTQPMNEPDHAPQPFFESVGFQAVEIGLDEAPRLQRFFDANPDYFIAVAGEPAGADEAYEEVVGEPPAGWPYTKKWIIGFARHDGEFVAMANLITDLLARGVWHIGLFIVATETHGDGTAHVLVGQLERWAVAAGAGWLRLGVVEGNRRAEGFWTKCGFVELRRREGIAMGKKVNTIRTLVKALGTDALHDALDDALDRYLALVPRDDPQAP